jgi:rare lipoprotein A
MKNVCISLFLIITFPLFISAKNFSDSIAFNDSKNVATIQYGIASYYHNKFEGRKTANGEIFRQKKLTAACNTLPLNCWVRITNLKNKKQVILWINDRMHRDNPRLVDLSRTAALTLGYTGEGLANVKVEYLGKKKPG